MEKMGRLERIVLIISVLIIAVGIAYAGVKTIPQLTEMTAVIGTTLVEVWDVDAASGSRSKHSTVANLGKGVTVPNISQVTDITATAAEINYTTDVTGLIQAQLDARALESVVGTSIGTGMLLDGAVLKTSAILQKYHAIDPSADVQSALGAANAAAILVALGVNATESEIDTPLDGALVTLTEFRELETIGDTTLSANQWAALGSFAETLTGAEINILDGVSGVTPAELSYIGDVTGLIQAQLDLKAPLANPTFTGVITIGSAGISEAELEIIDGATTTTDQLNYLNTATGTTGTNTTNLVYSTSPQLTTPDLGAATADSLTLDASATPGWVFRDSDNVGSDKEIGKIYSNATTTTDGAEDGEIHIQVMDSGSEKTVLHADGDTGVEHVEVGPADCTYDMHTYYSISTVDGAWSGTAVIRTVKAGQTSVFGQVLHVDTDGELIVADADVASAGAAPGIYMALEAGTGAKLVLEQGYITETDWNWTPGAIMYLDDDPTENEGITAVAGIPATTGDQVQVLGVAISADTIKFAPSLVLVEVP